MTATAILSESTGLKVTSRKDAFKLGLSHYFTGKPCINGHLSPKNMSGGCLECSRIKMAQKRAAEVREPRVLLSQKEKKRRKAEGDKLYRLATQLTDAQKEAKIARMAVWRDKNRDKLNGFARKYYAADPEKHREATKRWAEKNPDKVKEIFENWLSKSQDKIKEYRDRYHLDNKIERNQQSRLWRKKNSERVKLYANEYREKNQDKIRDWARVYTKEKAQTNPLFAMKRRVRILILNQIRARGYTKRSRTQEILGCDWDFFKSHLERQFLKGMTWDNRSEWHIDHITPIAVAQTEDDVIALNHFTNLRPIWAKDNLSKGAQMTHLI